MRYAIKSKDGEVHNIVDVPADANPYVPPNGFTMAEATADDEHALADAVAKAVAEEEAKLAEPE